MNVTTSSTAHGWTLASGFGPGAGPAAFHRDCDECRRLIAARDPRQLVIAEMVVPVCDDSPETGEGATDA